MGWGLFARLQYFTIHCDVSFSAVKQLGVDDLPVVVEKLNDTRVKWYEIGLQLGVSVGTLNAIKKDYNSTSDCLRETLTTWLKTSPSPPTWNNIVNVLRRSTVGELRLAEDLEQKYCSTQDANIAATHQHALPLLSQADTQTTTPQKSPSQAHAPPASHVPLSQALTQTTPPPQYTIPPTQPPVLAYSVLPPSHPPPWSLPYYYLPHTSYRLSTPFPLTPSPSGVATASAHPSYSQTSQFTPTSSRPLLPLVPAQMTIHQFPTASLQYQPSFPTQYSSPSSLTTIPPDTSPILLPATVTTPPDFPPPIATHTMGMY